MKPRKYCQDYTKIEDLELKKIHLCRNLRRAKRKDGIKIALMEIGYFLCCLIGLAAFVWVVMQLTYFFNS